MKNISITAALVAFTVSAHADVSLNGIFTDHMVLQRDLPVAVYGTADPGEKVTVSCSGMSKSATAGKDGHWLARLDAMHMSTASAVLTVEGRNKLVFEDILVGDVWVCSGQSNMDFCPGSYGSPYDVKDFELPLVRQFHVAGEPSMSPVTSVEGNTDIGRSGEWVVCSPETGNHICAVGLYFARKVHLETGVPIGLVKSAWNGTRIEPWISPEGWASVPELPPVGKLPPQPVSNPFPSTYHCLYNGKIHPLTKYGIKGVLWYQGESNSREGDIYFHKMRALIGDWRTAFGQGDFPFYYVQLAAHNKPIDDPAGGNEQAMVRMAQLKSLAVPNTGMAVAIDLDNENRDVHIWD